MASYPTVPFSDAESSRTHVPRRRVLTTRSNRARAQEYGDAELYRFVLTHDLITAGERDAIVDHYEAHLASEFALTHWRDNVTYNVIYDEAGIQVDHVAGQWWRVQVHLIGRRAP